MSDKCGTRAGWNQHVKQGEKACDECNEANRLYNREYRRLNGHGRAFTFPTEISDALGELDGLGYSIARALRESA